MESYGHYYTQYYSSSGCVPIPAALCTTSDGYLAVQRWDVGLIGSTIIDYLRLITLMLVVEFPYRRFFLRRAD